MKPSDYTFETFVATPSNRLAQLAAKKISYEKAKESEPLSRWHRVRILLFHGASSSGC